MIWMGGELVGIGSWEWSIYSLESWGGEVLLILGSG